MKYFFAAIFSLLSVVFSAQENADSLAIRKFYTYHLTQSNTYENLRYLCKKIGGRISGSPQAEKAVEWAEQAMLKAGADTVYLIPCMVPKWVRGPKEQCMAAKGAIKEKLTVCALGGSVGTGKKGITAKVIEVTSFEEMEKLGAEKIKGNIVFFNVSFDAGLVSPGSAYGKAVKYRWAGPSKAAKLGAIATVVKSMTNANNDVPHTGAMGYDSLVKDASGQVIKIPAFALSPKGASMLAQLLLKDKNLQLYLFSDCQMLPDVPSFSVVGEIRGKEIPNEVIVTGGHLDSWDTGEGAHDDGAGVVQSIEIIAAIKASGIKNKRTIRSIAFMNEENGLRGGTTYGKFAENEKNKKHIAAIESDGGGLVPRSLGIDVGTDTLAMYYEKWEKLFKPYGVLITNGGGGADIGPLEKIGATQMSLNVDNQRYFDYHHTPDDVFENVHKRELELGSAAMTSLVYLLDKYGVFKK
ncbi:MAG TPA: M20/M25/M40 family metallo-hydrolase [Bacteroidia bacterium]|jgi:carboxypeptidase Q|nr:M20/M25/M40 family metallo-hydrolase [Bacteroidia bacterium]